MAHAAVHFEIGGPDAKALEEFYGRLFGWSIDANNPMDYPIVHRMPGGIGGGLPKSPGGSPFVTFYVTCGEDVAGMLRKALAQGAAPALEVSEIPAGPTIAAFRDLDGNLVGLVSGMGDEDAPVEGKGDPVMWFELGCSDAPKAQDFYRDLFGWTIDAHNPMGYGEVAAQAKGIGGGVSPSPRGPYVTVYVQVADLAATLAKVKALGGTTITEPVQVPGGPTIAHFGDVAGNFVGLILGGSGSSS